MESKKINLFHYLIFVFCFFPFTFKPLRIIQVGIVYGGGFFYVLFHLNFLISKINIKTAFNSFHAFFLVLIVLLVRPINTMDFSFLIFFFSVLRGFILILCMTIILLRHNKNSFTEIAEIYINVLCIYVLCSLLLYIPQIRKIWLSILYTTEQGSEIIESLVYYTRFGLQGFSGWSHTVHCSIGVIFFWLLKLNGKKISYIKYLLLLIGCACYGRSGLIVSFICSVIACICAIKLRKVKYFIFISFLGIILLVALLIYMEYFSTEYNAFSWMFEPFVNKLRGKSASGSSNELKQMYQNFHLDTVFNLLFGYGLYTEPGTTHYFQMVDIGWARPLLFGGLFFEIIYYTSLLLLIITSANSCAVKMREMFILLFIVQFFIFELKGETYLMFSRILLLFCFAEKGAKNEISVCDKSVQNRRRRKSFLKYCCKYNG